MKYIVGATATWSYLKVLYLSCILLVRSVQAVLTNMQRRSHGFRAGGLSMHAYNCTRDNLEKFQGYSPMSPTTLHQLHSLVSRLRNWGCEMPVVVVNFD